VKRTSTTPPVYPPSYNPELVRGTVQWAKAFNKWAAYIDGELADERMLKQAKKILIEKL
jgi:hypothetical protein